MLPYLRYFLSSKTVLLLCNASTKGIEERLAAEMSTLDSKKPKAVDGFTNFIASDRGHLLPGLKRGKAWPDFKGTWEMPARLPLGPVNPMGRSVQGRCRLGAFAIDPKHTTTCSQPQGNTNSSKPESERQAGVEQKQQLENAAPFLRPQSQVCSTSGERPGGRCSENGQISRTESGPSTGSEGLRMSE